MLGHLTYISLHHPFVRERYGVRMQICFIYIHMQYDMWCIRVGGRHGLELKAYKVSTSLHVLFYI